MANYFDYSGPTRFWHGEYLPHLEVDRGIYFVTFCLEDSIPRKKLARLTDRREKRLKRLEQQNKLTPAKRQLIDDEYFEEVDELLDAGYGSQLLGRDDVARIVADALEYFHGDRYDLDVWTIMSTHVHVTLQTRTGHWLVDVLKSWKSFTGNVINRLVGRSGKLWQGDSYDRLMRSEEELQQKRRYIWHNHQAAGFDDWKWRKQYPDRWTQ